jgi:MFS family permease
VLLFFLAATRLPADGITTRRERVDAAGAGLYALALVATMYGISLLPAWRGAATAIGGLLLLAGFVAREARCRSPLIEVDLFRRNRLFALSSLAALINYSATFAVVFLISLYLQYIHGLSPRAAGTVLVAQPLVMAIFSPLAGRLSDRYGTRVIATTGMALTAVGLALFIPLDAGSGLVYVVGCNMLLGFGFALFSSPNMSAIMGAVPRRQYGVASGTVSTMRLLGQMLSMGVATTVLAVAVGRVEITPARHPEFLLSLRICFTLFAVLCVFGIPASLARGSTVAADETGNAG